MLLLCLKPFPDFPLCLALDPPLWLWLLCHGDFTSAPLHAYTLPLCTQLQCPWASFQPVQALLASELCCACLWWVAASSLPRVLILSDPCSVITTGIAPLTVIFYPNTPPWVMYLFAYLVAAWSLWLESGFAEERVFDLLTTLSSRPTPKPASQKVLNPYSSNEVERRGCFGCGSGWRQGGSF